MFWVRVVVGVRDGGRERERDGNGASEEEGRRQTVSFLVLLVLPHSHEAGAGGEGFVAQAALVVGLLGVPLVIVDLFLGLLGVV